jgi:hypothetical protein
MEYCENCGTTRSPEPTFCTNCGHKKDERDELNGTVKRNHQKTKHTLLLKKVLTSGSVIMVVLVAGLFFYLEHVQSPGRAVEVVSGEESNDKGLEQQGSVADENEAAVGNQQTAEGNETIIPVDNEDQIKEEASAFVLGKLDEMMKLYYGVDRPSDSEIKERVNKLFKEQAVSELYYAYVETRNANEVREINYNKDSEMIYVNLYDNQNNDSDRVDYIIVTEALVRKWADDTELRTENKTFHLTLEKQGDDFTVTDINIQRGHTVDGAAAILSSIGQRVVVEKHLQNFFDHAYAFKADTTGEAINALKQDFRDDKKLAHMLVNESSFYEYQDRDLKLINSEVTEWDYTYISGIEDNPYSNRGLYGGGIFTLEYEENGTLKTEDFNFEIILSHENEYNEEWEHVVEDLVLK